MKELPRVSRLCVIFTLLTLGPLAAQEPDSVQLLELNRTIFESLLLENDPKILVENASPDYRVIAPGGRVETLEMVLEGVDSVKAEGLELSQQEVVHSGDTAILIGKLEIDGTMRPIGRFPPMKFLTVFRRIDGEWRMLARSMTPCLPVAIERGVC